MKSKPIGQFDSNEQQTTEAIWIEVDPQRNLEESVIPFQEEETSNAKLDTLSSWEIELSLQDDLPELWEDTIVDSGPSPTAEVQMMILRIGGPAAAALMAFGGIAAILLVPGGNAVAITLAVGATAFLILLGLAFVIHEIRKH
jgi:hypothetical protein